MRAAAARASAGGARHPSPAFLEHVPVLHELRRDRLRAPAPPLPARARAAGRLGAGGGRLGNPQGSRSYRPSQCSHGAVHGVGIGLPSRRGHPSIYDLLAAIHAAEAEQVVVLANSPNVVLAAERAAELSDKTVRVVRSRSQQAGLAAAVSLDSARTAEQNATAMIDTLERIRTGAVAPAARDDAHGRFREGEAVGFVEEEIVAWGNPRETLRGVLEQLADNAELITCLRGADVPLDDETVQALAAGEVEFELSNGGQQSYWWLLSAE
ncbi:MAG: hypothetical protein E6G05_05220 [Actinobacteria bacterium]|nr:MAG: hypothetical protein E6G05_05220 [Actinomycetota bacterium]